MRYYWWVCCQELEAENNHRLAEYHFIEGKDWKSTVNMYRAADKWEDAYRVAKSHGGPNASKQVAYLWAKDLGGDSAVKLLTKFGLLEDAINYSVENLWVCISVVSWKFVSLPHYSFIA